VTSDPRHPGDLLVRVGAGLFAIGLVATVVVLVPFLTRAAHQAPLAVDYLMLLLPGGFGLALLGLLRGARAHHQ
jgi:hypothetical protein